MLQLTAEGAVAIGLLIFVGNISLVNCMSRCDSRVVVAAMCVSSICSFCFDLCLVVALFVCRFFLLQCMLSVLRVFVFVCDCCVFRCCIYVLNAFFAIVYMYKLFNNKF